MIGAHVISMEASAGHSANMHTHVFYLGAGEREREIITRFGQPTSLITCVSKLTSFSIKYVHKYENGTEKHRSSPNNQQPM